MSKCQIGAGHEKRDHVRKRGGGVWHIIEATHKTATFYPPLCFPKILKTKEDETFFSFVWSAHMRGGLV